MLKNISSLKAIMCPSATWILWNKLMYAIGFIHVNCECLRKLIKNLILHFLRLIYYGNHMKSTSTSIFSHCLKM